MFNTTEAQCFGHFFVKMIRNVLRGYATVISVLFKILLLLCLCAFAAFVVVFPLWKLAVSFPKQYSIIIIYACVIAFVILFFYRLRNRIKIAGTAEQKRMLLQKTIKNTAKFLIVAAGLAAALTFLYKEKLIASFSSIILTVLLYGILAFGTTKSNSDAKDSKKI